MSQHSLHNHDTFSSRRPVLSRKRRTNFGGGFFNAHNLNAWEKRGREAEEKRKEQQRLDEIKRKLDNPRQNMNKYVRQKFKNQAGMFYSDGMPDSIRNDPGNKNLHLREKKPKEMESNVPRNLLEMALNNGPGRNRKTMAERIATLIALGNASIGVGKGSWGVGNKALGKNLRTTGTTRTGRPFQKLSPSKTRSGKKYGATSRRRDPPPVEMEMDEVPGPSSAEQPTEKTPLFTQKGQKQGYDLEMDSVPNTADEAGHGSEETPFNGGASGTTPEGKARMEPQETTRDRQSSKEFWENDGKWDDDAAFNEGNSNFESFEEWQRKLQNANRKLQTPPDQTKLSQDPPLEESQPESELELESEQESRSSLRNPPTSQVTWTKQSQPQKLSLRKPQSSQVTWEDQSQPGSPGINADHLKNLLRTLLLSLGNHFEELGHVQTLLRDTILNFEGDFDSIADDLTGIWQN